MRPALVALASPGSYAAFHAITLACALTGGFVLLTAGDLGPWAPLLLAMGMYSILFAAVAQLALALRRIAAAIALRKLARVSRATAR